MNGFWIVFNVVDERWTVEDVGGCWLEDGVDWGRLVEPVKLPELEGGWLRGLEDVVMMVVLDGLVLTCVVDDKVVGTEEVAIQ